MSTEDSMRKATENLDKAAGAAPSSEFLDKVKPSEFGTSDEDDNGAGDDTSEDDNGADEPNEPDELTADEAQGPSENE